MHRERRYRDSISWSFRSLRGVPLAQLIAEHVDLGHAVVGRDEQKRPSPRRLHVTDSSVGVVAPDDLARGIEGRQQSKTCHRNSGVGRPDW